MCAAAVAKALATRHTGITVADIALAVAGTVASQVNMSNSSSGYGLTFSGFGGPVAGFVFLQQICQLKSNNDIRFTRQESR